MGVKALCKMQSFIQILVKNLIKLQWPPTTGHGAVHLNRSKYSMVCTVKSLNEELETYNQVSN